MGFYSVVEQWKDFDYENYFARVTDEDVLDSIYKENLTEYDLLNLLSPKAKNHLERMAQRAAELKTQHFGNIISLYMPIYISNFCTNNCTYCGFSKKNHIVRKHQTLEQIEAEAIEIAKTGVEHILMLTGEAHGLVTLDYLKDAVKVLKKHFNSVSIEVMPLEEWEYKELADIGVDGLTVYQETYNEEIYDKVHLSGKKKDYHFRLNTPERGAKAYDMDNQVPEEIKEERWVELTNLQSKIAENKNRAMLGQTVEVMIDGVSTESEYLLEGRTKGQALEIDGKVLTNDGTAKPGEIVKVKLEQNFDYDFIGPIVENEKQ